MAKTVNKNLSDVQAKKGELTRSFPRQTWDLLGPTKQGWEEVKETPKELLNPDGGKAPAPEKPETTKTPVVKQLTVAQQKKADAEALKNASTGKDSETPETKEEVKETPTEEELAAKLAEGGNNDGEEK